MTSGDSNPVTSPGPVGEWEELGRAIFFRSHRRRASNTGLIPYQAFLEQAGERRISVDRLTRAPLPDVAANARRVGEQRDPPRNFYGWAVVRVSQVRNAGCEVEDSPLPGNPYHADIVLPDSIEDNRDEQELYAVMLAGMARWRPCPLAAGETTS